MIRRTAVAAALAGAAFLSACPALAGEDAGSGPDASGSPSAAAASDQGGVGGYFAHWFDRVKAAQESQPHWITPVATTTPRLEEEFRFDFGFQSVGNGQDVTNYGMGKGLELIPTQSTEVILNIPPYVNRYNKKPATGFNDDPVLLVKQRFLSANEENGNYILTGFLGLQAPTGIKALTNHAYIVTPTIAAGKGWGNFDIQATMGVAYPTSHQHTIGTSVPTNITFQYHLGKYFWPELEINDTYWVSGPREGKQQVFLTPGFVLGRFVLAGRMKAIVGAGYQIAVAPSPQETKPVLTPTYEHQLILTTRLTF
jgi:hypothetical protein